MVSLEVVQKSNAQIAKLPKGLVALFVGATSGIGWNTLQQFSQNASSPRIYSVARKPSAEKHDAMLASLGKVNPSVKYSLITADVSLIAEVNKVVEEIKRKESKLDLLVLSAGFMPLEGRTTTKEGLDPSMTTRYHSRLRLLQLLLPLLNHEGAISPRVVWVLGGGLENKINESDLALQNPENWSAWNASLHSGTMGTLALEHLARDNPRISIVHSFPGPVETPGLERIRKLGASQQNAMSAEESGARTLFLATNDRYARTNGFVPNLEGLPPLQETAGGIFLIDPHGESKDNEPFLSSLRERKVDDLIWNHTQDIFESLEVPA